MKLRLTGAGFENFTGQMGVIFFEDGLSTGDVHPNEGKRVAGVIGAQWEDGSHANVGDIYAASADVAAPTQEEQDAAKEALSEATVVAEQAAAAAYTADELAEIADKQGIEGLRAIGDPLGVKAKSIQALIDGILAKAGAKAE